MNIENVFRARSLNFKVGSMRAPATVSCSEVDTQNSLAHFLYHRNRSVTNHPVVVMIRREDDTFLYPVHCEPVCDDQKSKSLLDNSPFFAGFPLYTPQASVSRV